MVILHGVVCNYCSNFPEILIFGLDGYQSVPEEVIGLLFLRLKSIAIYTLIVILSLQFYTLHQINFPEQYTVVLIASFDISNSTLISQILLERAKRHTSLRRRQVQHIFGPSCTCTGCCTNTKLKLCRKRQKNSFSYIHHATWYL